MCPHIGREDAPDRSGPFTDIREGALCTRRSWLVVAGATLPLHAARTVRAQHLVRVGVLSPGATRFPPHEVFDETLEAQGWVLGKTITIEYRFSSGRADVDAINAAELVRQPVDLLVAWGPSPALAAKDWAHRIPLVFLAVNGPVERGLVQSLSHPGGNITGITFEAGEGIFRKQLQLLSECVPRLTRVGVLIVAWEPVRPTVRAALADAARTLGIDLSEIELGTPDDLESAVANAKHRRIQALFVLPTSFAAGAHRKHIADLALVHGLPSIHGPAEAAAAGALMSYAPSFSDVARQGAILVHRILKGAKPADLPVQEPTRFELVINMRTARALGVNVPRTTQLRADRVLE